MTCPPHWMLVYSVAAATHSPVCVHMGGIAAEVWLLPACLIYLHGVCL